MEGWANVPPYSADYESSLFLDRLLATFILTVISVQFYERAKRKGGRRDVSMLECFRQNLKFLLHATVIRRPR